MTYWKRVQECHEPGNEAVACPLEHGEEAGKEGRADGESDCPALDQIGDEEGARGLVETMLLFEDEGLVVGERERRQTRHEEQCECEGY